MSRFNGSLVKRVKELNLKVSSNVSIEIVIIDKGSGKEIKRVEVKGKPTYRLVFEL